MVRSLPLFQPCRLPLHICQLPGARIYLGEASEAYDQTSRYIYGHSTQSLTSTKAFGWSSITLKLASFTCQVCKKVFKKVDVLRRHKRIHASHKPVLVCPRDGCQAYFSTTFNLQHHIRKVHLNLLKYKCSFPDCPRMFAMRVSDETLSLLSCRAKFKVVNMVLTPTGEYDQTPTPPRQ